MVAWEILRVALAWREVDSEGLSCPSLLLTVTLGSPASKEVKCKVSVTGALRRAPAPSSGVTDPLWFLSAESSPTGLQPMAPPPPDDVHSDDSDEIVMAPSLPTRKSAPPP